MRSKSPAFMQKITTTTPKTNLSRKLSYSDNRLQITKIMKIMKEYKHKCWLFCPWDYLLLFCVQPNPASCRRTVPILGISVAHRMSTPQLYRSVSNRTSNTKQNMSLLLSITLDPWLFICTYLSCFLKHWLKHSESFRRQSVFKHHMWCYVEINKRYIRLMNPIGFECVCPILKI